MESRRDYERSGSKVGKNLGFSSSIGPAKSTTSYNEPERLFRASGNGKKFIDILLMQSKLRLCSGQVYQSIDSAESAVVLAQSYSSPGVEMKLRLQRCLANLFLGLEDKAYEDMIKHQELAEVLDDLPTLVRGHFYLALIYERHGEPCMAAAELGMGRDLARTIRARLPEAKISASLAHLFLRRGVLSEAENLVKEAFELSKDVPENKGSSCIGFVHLVDAEIHAAYGRWAESAISFKRSIRAFRLSRFKSYYEALAHQWYGETLQNLNRMGEAHHLLMLAKNMFEKQSNTTQAKRVECIMSCITGDPKPSPN